MSGATHSRASSDLVTIGADVYADGYTELSGAAYRQKLRQDFMRMASEAEAILADQLEAVGSEA